jgi:hypothetical protein
MPTWLTSPLKTLLHQRFQWRNDTIKSVNWEAFSKAFRARYRYQTFNFKLCFRLLPNCKTLHIQTNRFNPRCPACNHEIECNNHLFQCQQAAINYYHRLKLYSHRLAPDTGICVLFLFFQKTGLELRTSLRTPLPPTPKVASTVG